ncbi:MAG: acetoacetate decarboxylase [Leptospirales bacterium]|nr:acetoacetate decarboxylase [Leptospirales bacterium]
MMLVNYHQANCGPYQELLYIPGSFSYSGGNCKRITRIFVSSAASVEWGMRNWAIPKDLAEFEWQKGERSTFVEVRQGRNVFLRARMERGLLPFPVSSAFFPFALVQRGPEALLRTRLRGRGTGRRIRLTEFFINEKYFPDMMESGGGRFGIAVDPFRLVFPAAEVVPLA